MTTTLSLFCCLQMSTLQNTPSATEDGVGRPKEESNISLPVFQVVSNDEKNETTKKMPVAKPRMKKKIPQTVMEEGVTMAQVHSTPVKVHRSGRKSKSQSRHDRHRCHKSRARSREVDRTEVSKEKLQQEITKLRSENYLLSKKLNLSLTSLDSGLTQSEVLPPFEMDVNKAYQHIKNENTKLLHDLTMLKTEYQDMSNYLEKVTKDNETLKDDILLLKNLVYRLNVELEKYQLIEADERESDRRWDLLPENYQKNFLRPVLPLLKAYSETVKEKNEIIDSLERDFKRFHTSFHEVMKENEKLYNELEKKSVKCNGSAKEELKRTKKELEASRQEVELLTKQVTLNREKLQEVHSVYRVKVSEAWKEKEQVMERLHECKAELYTAKGKLYILKQEFERLKLDSENRIPLTVHSASITECKRLFYDLKNEYESEKRNLLMKIKELEERYHGKEGGGEKGMVQKENDELKRRIRDLETMGDGHTKKLLREANAKTEELSKKLATTKKQLHKAMAFAEDIVREQEGLLLQLHNKQKENHYITSQFGSLKKQIKSVEKGANEGLNNIEQAMKEQESENAKLTAEVKKLQTELKQKDEIMERLQPSQDSSS